MKTLIAVLSGFLIACASMTSQQWTDIAGIVFEIATKTVLQKSTTTNDWNSRADVIIRLQKALAQLKGRLATPEDIKSTVLANTPKTLEYKNLADQLALVYARQAPTTVAKSDSVIDQISLGLGSIR